MSQRVVGFLPFNTYVYHDGEEYKLVSFAQGTNLVTLRHCPFTPAGVGFWKGKELLPDVLLDASATVKWGCGAAW